MTTLECDSEKEAKKRWSDIKEAMGNLLGMDKKFVSDCTRRCFDSLWDSLEKEEILKSNTTSDKRK